MEHRAAATVRLAVVTVDLLKAARLRVATARRAAVTVALRKGAAVTGPPAVVGLRLRAV